MRRLTRTLNRHGKGVTMQLFRRISAVVVLGVLTIGFFPSSPVRADDLLASPLVQELITITEDIFHRAGQADPTAMRTAFENNDLATVRQLLGYTTHEAEQIELRLNELRRTIFRQFPEVSAAAASMTSCGLNPSAGSCNVQALGNFPTSNTLAYKQIEQAVTCDWGQYIAALALCTAGGPFWYWPCAYLALCAYCHGGWVADVCF